MKKAILIQELTNSVLNGRTSYRVKIPLNKQPKYWEYHEASVYVRHDPGGYYHYAVGRNGSRLYKVYIGAAGNITISDLRAAVKRLITRMYKRVK